MSNEQSDIQIIEQRDVQFYDDMVIGILVEEDGQTAVYVPVRPICDALGVDRRGQQQRVERDEVLSDVSRMITVKGSGGVTPPQGRAMLCLPLDFLNGFLFGINASRVKPEIKPRILRYQRECYKVLAEAWREGRLSPNQDEAIEVALRNSSSPAVESYKMLDAMKKLARHQIILELHQQENREQIADHEQRLEALETAVSRPNRHVSESQAAQISQAVKAVAIAQGKQTKRNEFGAVYGELYRRYGINSYKLLPLSKYEEAMGFLNEWLASLTGDEPF